VAVRPNQEVLELPSNSDAAEVDSQRFIMFVFLTESFKEDFNMLNFL